MNRLVAFVAVSVGIAACAIEADPTPETIDLPVPASPLEFAPSAPDTSPATIYLVSATGDLVPIRRDVEAGGSTSTHLEAALRALTAGPTAEEADRGVRTAVPVTTEIRSVDISEGTATVDLSASFLSIGGSTEILAVGQVVVTCATHPGVQRVVLAIEGSTVAVPLPSGALRDAPVDLALYASLLAPESSPPTTTVADP